MQICKLRASTQNVYQISLSESKLEKCQFCHKMSHLQSNDSHVILKVSIIRISFRISWLCGCGLQSIFLPPPVHNLNLRLRPPVAKELLVSPGRQEDGVKPEKNHEHDHSDVLGARHRLLDSPHVQWRPHCHGARHSCDVHLLLSVNQPHGQIRNSGKLFKSF